MKASKDDVQQVFRQVFDMEDLGIFPEMTAKDVGAWDSFNHLNLVLALEERFNIKFSTQEMAAMAKVGDLFVLLNKHGVEIEW
jgi:acyl carrier protein